MKIVLLALLLLSHFIYAQEGQQEFSDEEQHVYSIESQNHQNEEFPPVEPEPVVQEIQEIQEIQEKPVKQEKANVLDWELVGERVKTILQTDATEYNDPGWKLNDIRELEVKIDIPQELTEGKYNMNPGYKVKYFILENGKKIYEDFRVVRVDNVDECELKTHQCHVNAICIDTLGSYECKCKEGFEGSGRYCTAIDYCAKHPYCPPHSKCKSKHLSFECECEDGYEKNNAGDCVKVNECEKGTHKCKNAYCVFSEGDYRCVCKDGYKHKGNDPYVCERIDKCATKELVCSQYGTCYYDIESDSDKCRCNPGFIGDGKSCADEDECATGKAVCPDNSVCRNTFGSYECDCVKGYEKKGKICVDIDECARRLHDCDKNAECINIEGSYICECKKGFKKDEKGKCISTDGPQIFLNGDNPSTYILGDFYQEAGYKAIDPSGAKVDVISKTRENELRGKLKSCGLYHVDYHIQQYPDVKATRDVRVIGIDLCLTGDADLVRKCKEHSHCVSNVEQCTTECVCDPGYKKDVNGDCIDNVPPVILCPNKDVFVRQCLVCDDASSHFGTDKYEEEKAKARCVAFDEDPSNPVALSVKQDIQTKLNAGSLPGEITIPAGTTDLTASITTPIEEVQPHRNCSSLIHSVTDASGNTNSASVSICRSIVDMRAMALEMEDMRDKYSRYIQALVIAICITIAWLLILAFGEFARKIYYFFQVVIFGDTSNYERSQIAYTFWYSILHPLSTEKEIKRIVQNRLLEDEENEDDDDDDEAEEEDDADDEEDEDDDEEEEEEKKSSCSVM